MINRLILNKRIMVFIIIVSMSLNCFAAVVDGNDGAAFITKAEFDALKSNFSNQLDNYNDSINKKLDGAIASYLAGIQIANTEEMPILVGDWESVTELNGALKQEYDYPNMTGSLIILQKIIEKGHTPDQLQDTTLLDIRDWWKQIWCTASINRYADEPNNTRNLVGNVVIQATPDKTNMVWKGHANRAKELWTLSIVRTYDNNPSSMQTDNEYNLFSICECLNLIRTGYIASFNDTSNPVWKPAVRWRGGDQRWVNWGYGTTVAISTVPTISYEKDSSGKLKSYEHIITHKSDDTWEVCAENVTNYISFSSNNSLRTDGWLNGASATGVWNGCEFMHGPSTTASSNISINALQIGKSVAWTDNTYTGTENKKEIPVIGLLGEVTSGSIYQFADNDLKDADGISITKRKLHEGLPIMKVKSAEKIEWTPEFKNIYVDGVTGVNECKIKLSYVPFTNEGTVSDNDDLVKMDGITLNDWAKTTDGKVKITFNSDRNAYIYAKWVPDTTDSNISDKDWEVTLDIENCNTWLSLKD